jgi:hypothetical protein
MIVGLVSHGVATAAAARVSHLPPVATLFAAFLGYNPVQHLVGPGVLARLPAAQHAALTGRSFFPTLIIAPFRSGLRLAFDFAIVASLLAAVVSWTRSNADGHHRRRPAIEANHSRPQLPAAEPR